MFFGVVNMDGKQISAAFFGKRPPRRKPDTRQTTFLIYGQNKRYLGTEVQICTSAVTQSPTLVQNCTKVKKGDAPIGATGVSHDETDTQLIAERDKGGVLLTLKLEEALIRVVN